MIKKLIPDKYYKTINDIPYTELYDKGFRLILTDLDNTLISYKETDPTPELFDWLKMVTEIGFEVIIVSNSKKYRVEYFADQLNIKFVKYAQKPLKKGLKRALKIASRKYDRSEVVEIGDQIMTDVFGSKRCKLYTIIVKAIDRKTEVWTTKINRKLERFFLKRIKKKLPDLYNERLLEYVGDKDDFEEM